jgi:hypothetical protein
MGKESGTVSTWAQKNDTDAGNTAEASGEAVLLTYRSQPLPGGEA